MELFHIKNNLGKLYNIQNNDLLDYKYTDEGRNNVSNSIKEWHKNNKHPLLGIGHTNETKRKQSEIKKGKYSGENNPNLRLTIEDYKQIKLLLIQKVKLNEIAIKYNCSPETISLFRRGKSWANKILGGGYKEWKNTNLI